MTPRFPLLALTGASMAALLLGCAVENSAAASNTPSPSTINTAAAQAPAEQAQVLRQAIAPALYEIAYSPKQNAIFVASAGGREANAPAPRILRLNPQTLAIEAEILLERPGLGLTLDDEANRLYVGNAFHASITLLNTQTNAVEAVVQLTEKVKMKDFDGKETERYPHNLRELVLDKANHRLYAPGLWISDSVLYVVDTDKLKTEIVIPGFGFGAAGITLDSQRGKVYVGNMQGQLLTIDARTLALDGIQEIAADQLLNLAMDKQTGHILAIDHGSANPNMVREKFAKLDYTVRGNGNRVAVIDPVSGKVLESITSGQLPVALVVDEARHRLFVTNRESATVAVLDTRDHRVVHTFDLPSHPNSLALDPVSGVVFATIKNGDNDANNSNESVARLAL